MSLPLPYKQINKLVEEQTFESTFTWGMRMAISATMPLIWGAITGRIPEAIWMSLAAEGICFVELRGSFGQGLRVLIAGVFLTYIFSLFGSITGINIWLSVIGMLIVGFLSGLFKNLGDRGSALSVSVFVVYIICNAFPTHTLHELNERMWLILAGGVWTAFVGIVILAFIPAQEPYRRTIGLIWKAVADLSATISYGWDGKTIRSSTRDIYQKEKAVRTAIDTSLHFYSTLAHQTQANTREHHMAHVRKATAVLSTHINAISEELETISIKDINKTLQLRIHDVLKGLQQTADRMAVFIITLKPEDELLIGASIKRLQQFVSILKEHAPANEDKYAYQVKRVVQLSERCIKLIESCVKRLEDMETDKPVFQSYSLLKTIIILHPRHWLKNIVILFNFNTFTTRYAIRTALAATVAIFISKWFNIDHGYWIPFTVIIVSQPYFGATFKKRSTVF